MDDNIKLLVSWYCFCYGIENCK